MYPTKEILIKHAVSNLGLVKRNLMKKDESGIIDDVPTVSINHTFVRVVHMHFIRILLM